MARSDSHNARFQSMPETPLLRKLSDIPISCSSCKICPAQGCDLRSQPYRADFAHFNRRTFVAGSLVLSAVGSSVMAQESVPATSESSAVSQVCVTLTPERTEGPYYIDDLLLRDDITEGKEGVPLDLEITVIDPETCEPLTDVAVDIWHCDALGDYSGISGQMGNDDTSGQTWLRGVQLTDIDGVARIRTIYPGWYVSRCTHIHLKVHTGGAAEDGTYIGGTTAHTGQLFFDDQVNDAVAELEPYRQRLDVYRTRNEEDSVLSGALSEPGFFVDLVPVAEDDIGAGFTGTVTLGVNPAAESSETGSLNIGSGGGNDQPSSNGSNGPGRPDDGDGPPPGGN